MTGPAVEVTEHYDRDAGQTWYGATCDEHGDLMDGDWHGRDVAEAAREAHLRDAHGLTVTVTADTDSGAPTDGATGPTAVDSELVDLLNEYGHAKFGDEWWPGNADAWIRPDRARRLADLLGQVRTAPEPPR